MTWNYVARLPPVHARKHQREHRLNEAMALVMGAGVKPNWLLQVLLAFYMWEQTQPIYPTRVMDVTLARWLLAYLDIPCTLKESLGRRARFLVHLGAELRKEIPMTAGMIYRMKDERPRFNKREYMKHYMRAYRKRRKYREESVPGTSP